jgi:pimeloyl-ACP methyl ester carboxylesterase
MPARAAVRNVAVMTTALSSTPPRTIAGGDGLQLHVREWGDRAGPPILFIHGWSQSHLCWCKQYESALADRFHLVAFDLRGHGMSQAPADAARYTDDRLWADDVAAVIDAFALDGAVLVGWSYGAFVACDYVRHHGDARIAAIDLVGGAVVLGPAAFGTLIGPGFLDPFAGATAEDLPTNIQAMRDFMRGCTAKPLPPEEFETQLCASTGVPAHVRADLVAREIDDLDVLAALDVPLLVTHGHADRVVLPAMAERVLDACPHAQASWYDGVGHAPHLEEPERFNRELADLTSRCAT